MELHIHNVHKSFSDNKVLSGASEVFEKGHIYALLGRNGSGKTTLFDLISGKKEVDEGEIFILDDGEKRPLTHKDLFYMVANPLLPNFLTGREFMQFFMDVNKTDIRETRNIDELFDWIELRDVERDKLIQTYSLGTKNKLQMLMFMLLAPPIILMDEPLTSLDVVVQLQIKNLLKQMEGNHIIIFSTHILQLARDLCDSVVILNHGKLSQLEEGRLQDPNVEQEIIDILQKEDADVHTV